MQDIIKIFYRLRTDLNVWLKKQTATHTVMHNVIACFVDACWDLSKEYCLYHWCNYSILELLNIADIYSSLSC